jgi:hypothetical protein
LIEGHKTMLGDRAGILGASRDAAQPLRFGQDTRPDAADRHRAALGLPLRHPPSQRHHLGRGSIKGHKPQSATSVASDWKRLGFGSRKVHGRKIYTGVEVDPEWIGAQDDYPMTR